MRCCGVMACSRCEEGPAWFMRLPPNTLNQTDQSIRVRTRRSLKEVLTCFKSGEKPPLSPNLVIYIASTVPFLLEPIPQQYTDKIELFFSIFLVVLPIFKWRHKLCLWGTPCVRLWHRAFIPAQLVFRFEIVETDPVKLGAK